MPANVVSSILRAAPDAITTYRRNKVLERMRKGGKHVFQAVDLMTSVHEVLDEDIKDAFTLCFNECEELRQIVEDEPEGFGTTGISDISEQYMSSAEALLDYAKVQVTCARARGLKRDGRAHTPLHIPHSTFPSGLASMQNLASALDVRPTTPALSDCSASSTSSECGSLPYSLKHDDETFDDHTPLHFADTEKPSASSCHRSHHHAYQVVTFPPPEDTKPESPIEDKPVPAGYTSYQKTNLPSLSHPNSSNSSPTSSPNTLPAIQITPVPDTHTLRRISRPTSRYRSQHSSTSRPRTSSLSRSLSVLSAPPQLESSTPAPPTLPAPKKPRTKRPPPALDFTHPPRAASPPGRKETPRPAARTVDCDAQLPPTPTPRDCFRSGAVELRRAHTAPRARPALCGCAHEPRCMWDCDRV